MSAHEQHSENDLANLVLNLDLLEEGRHEVSVDLPTAWVASILAETDAIVSPDQGDVLGSVAFEVNVQTDGTILIRGQLKLRYAVPCARCLDPAMVDAGTETGDMCVTFVPADRLRSWAGPDVGAGTGDGIGDDDDIDPLEPDELDQIGYQGSKLDLRALLAEQILLSYPMRALCARGEACRGLCTACGGNLNPAEAAAGSDAEAGPERCPSCGRRIDGKDEELADTPWKRALAKLENSSD